MASHHSPGLQHALPQQPPWQRLHADTHCSPGGGPARSGAVTAKSWAAGGNARSRPDALARSIPARSPPPDGRTFDAQPPKPPAASTINTWANIRNDILSIVARRAVRRKPADEISRIENVHSNGYSAGVRTIVILMLLLPATVWAKSTPAERAEARKHYDAGVAHYKVGEYTDAAAEFEEAIALRPMPQWLFNLASAYRAAKQPDKALENYRKYLDAAPDTPNRAQVQQRIAEAQREIDAKAPPPEPVRAEAPPSAPPEAVAPTPPPPTKAKSPGPKTPYEIGYRVRYIFVTNLMLKPYLDAATQMNSWSQALEFVYHRRTYDVVTSLDFSWLPVEDGNYLSAGHDPSLDTHYTQFRNLSFLSIDVSIIGHFDVTKWLQIRAGAGIGVGIVFGDVLLTNDSSACTKQNASTSLRVIRSASTQPSRWSRSSRRPSRIPALIPTQRPSATSPATSLRRWQSSTSWRRLGSSCLSTSLSMSNWDFATRCSWEWGRTTSSDVRSS